MGGNEREGGEVGWTDGQMDRQMNECVREKKRCGESKRIGKLRSAVFECEWVR